MEWLSAHLDGAIYGIPLTRKNSITECAHHSGMYIRTDILDKLGLPIPKTLEDLVAASLAARNAKLDYQIAYEYTNPPYALHRTYKEWPFYVDTESMLLYDNQGKVAAYPGSDTYYHDALTLSSMNKQGILRVFHSPDVQYSTMTKRWDILAAFCPAPPPNETIPYTVLQFEPQRENFNFNYVYGYLLAISKHCTDLNKVLDALECIYTEREVYDAFVYGKKDKDYSLDEKGRINILTTSILYQGLQQGFLAREDIKSTPRPAFYNVPESSVISTIPARLFVPSAIDDRNRLLQSDEYKGNDGILSLRIALSDPAAIDAAIERLDRDGLTKYINECQAEYTAFFK